jgi:hypothetical protein
MSAMVSATASVSSVSSAPNEKQHSALSEKRCGMAIDQIHDSTTIRNKTVKKLLKWHLNTDDAGTFIKYVSRDNFCDDIVIKIIAIIMFLIRTNADATKKTIRNLESKIKLTVDKLKINMNELRDQKEHLEMYKRALRNINKGISKKEDNKHVAFALRQDIGRKKTEIKKATIFQWSEPANNENENETDTDNDNSVPDLK